jgi:hypothetical protein
MVWAGLPIRKEESAMTDVSKSNLDDLRREVGRIAGGGGAFQDVSQPRDFRAYTPAPADSRLRDQGRAEAPAERGPFGRWLLRQENRGGAIGDLARCARLDPGFPKEGDPEAVRKRLATVMADGDMWEALDDAELDWSSY